MLEAMTDAAKAPTQQHEPGAVLLRRGECAGQCCTWKAAGRDCWA